MNMESISENFISEAFEKRRITSSVLAERIINDRKWAVAEIERLRAAGLGLVQHENGGNCMRQGGKPCREVEKCGCYLEFQEFINQQLGSKE